MNGQLLRDKWLVYSGFTSFNRHVNVKVTAVRWDSEGSADRSWDKSSQHKCIIVSFSTCTEARKVSLKVPKMEVLISWISYQGEGGVNDGGWHEMKPGRRMCCFNRPRQQSESNGQLNVHFFYQPWSPVEPSSPGIVTKRGEGVGCKSSAWGRGAALEGAKVRLKGRAATKMDKWWIREPKQMSV